MNARSVKLLVLLKTFLIFKLVFLFDLLLFQRLFEVLFLVKETLLDPKIFFPFSCYIPPHTTPCP